MRDLLIKKLGRVFIFERYYDSQSAIDHLNFFNDNYSNKFSKLVT